MTVGIIIDFQSIISVSASIDSFSYVRRCIYYSRSHIRSRPFSSDWDIPLLLFEFLWYGNMLWYILSLISRLIDLSTAANYWYMNMQWAYYSRLIDYVQALICWEWRRREVCCDLNVVCRAFHIGLFAAGLLGCRVYVNCTDTRVSIPSFGGFSLLLSALAGVQELVILAGENSELNSFISSI